MRVLKQAMAILGAAVTIALTIAVVSPKTAQAVSAILVQIEPGSTTHVGQNETQLVYLSCVRSESVVAAAIKGTCRSITSNGRVAFVDKDPEYVVPGGYTLVLTDYQVQGYLPSNITQNYDTLNLTDGAKYFVIPINRSSDGTYIATGSLTTGIRVASGEALNDQLASVEGNTATFEGYLVPN